MTFRAKLLRGSPIWRLWSTHARAGGTVAGVRFRWTPGGDFVTGDLGADEVARLRGVGDAVLEAFGAMPEPSAATVARVAPGRAVAHTPGWRKRLRESAGAEPTP